MDRANYFQINQVWQSPRGTLYKVVGFEGDGCTLTAILRKGADGSGAKTWRNWNAVENWVLWQDA